MHCSPVMRILTQASWIITALASINIGLRPFGFNIFDTDFFRNNLMNIVVPIHYLIGLAGIISLAAFVLMCSGHSDECNCK